MESHVAGDNFASCWRVFPRIFTDFYSKYWFEMTSLCRTSVWVRALRFVEIQVILNKRWQDGTWVVEDGRTYLKHRQSRAPPVMMRIIPFDIGGSRRLPDKTQSQYRRFKRCAEKRNVTECQDSWINGFEFLAQLEDVPRTRSHVRLGITASEFSLELVSEYM